MAIILMLSRLGLSTFLALSLLLLPVFCWTSRKYHNRRASFLHLSQDTADDATRSIYSMPALYDLAFGYRDYDEEVDFLMLTHERLANRPARSVLELAAGPARHSLSALLLPSVQSVTAVDVSPEMAKYARQVAEESLEDMEGFDYRVEDMRTFELASGQEKVDTAWLLLGSLQHLLENQDVIQCFRSVHKALADDGTFIIELPHPREIFTMVECTRNGWKVPLDGDDGKEAGELQIVWGDDGDVFDPVRQVRQFTVSMKLEGVDAKNDELQNVRQVVPTRHFTAREIEALAQCADLEVVEMFGALEEGVAVDDDDLAFRLVCVLRKQSGGSV